MYKSGGRPNAYEVNQISTASKTKLILLMYDGAIRFMMEAKRCMEMRDIAGRGKFISKAQLIINELAAALNREKGGQVAISLEKTYFEVNMRLTKANISGDTIHIDTAISMIRTIRDAWEQVINSSAGREAVTQERVVPQQGKTKVAISC